MTGPTPGPRARDAEGRGMDSGSQDRSGISPGTASNDQDLPTPIAEMSTAMPAAIERARA